MEGVQDLVQAAQLAAATVGDGDEVAAPVVGVGRPLDEVAPGQFVDDADHVAAVDAGAPAQARLAAGAEILE
ncbi:hypothetical protein SMD44_08473 [Streptomyces alboflavus]|uniref:Uncharacterized protein n=1 Tax=Streptomyces alboflavus TaxID=67267 RepID=A0A1Z1WRD4_9ACTN|nr:hypothetical protein SMD44_08473 [Streptomyces alboflavus]